MRIPKILMSFTVAAMITTMGGAVHAAPTQTTPALTVMTQSESVTLASFVGGGGRFCTSGYFRWSTFSSFKSWMDARYYRNANKVWQSPSDNATWDIWCRATSSRASLTTTSTGTTVVNPSVIYLADGTRMGFRATSKSGGYTIDINTKGTIYKVHRR